MNTVTKNETKQNVRPAVESENGLQRYVTPEVNIYETKDGYVLQAEVPGVNKDGLEVSIDGNELTILGRRSDTQPKAETLWRESSSADYRRVFELDPAIDTGKINAKVEQGVLSLFLPKSERVKPRKVTVSD